MSAMTPPPADHVTPEAPGADLARPSVVRPASAGERGRRPLRVCLVGPSLEILGGQSVVLARLLSRFGETDEIEVSFLPVNPRLAGPFRLLQRVKYVRTFATSIAYVASLLRRVPRVDVVHAFSASYWSFLLAPVPAMLAGRLFGKTVVLNYHSGEADDHLARWRTAIPLARLADVIAVPSGYLVDVFRRHGLDATAIFNFVDVERIPYRRRESLRPRFLSNRNLESLYNVACTIRAFARVQRVHPDAELIVAGDGRERAALERLVAELGLRHVTFTGRVAPERMPALYDDADVYFNSPDIDNMPSSVIEAYAAGLPVVTTDAGGIPYIVRHERTGMMVPAGDDVQLAEQALRLLREPALALAIADRARGECLERYVWPAVRDAWVHLYCETDARAAGRGVGDASGVRTLVA
ncbi:MAG: glycosyltransferase family 4 protein [Gemmatimonadaceae bacterium]|nr:glycosyltransferase family 4 protein [Gemmatimonadaceae bacterium]